MVYIGNDIAGQIASALKRGVPKGAQIQLKSDLPPQLQGRILQGHISEKTADGHYKITLSNGKTVEAQITPPPKLGSQISFVQLQNGESKLTAMVLEKIDHKGQNPQAAQAQNTAGQQQKNLQQGTNQKPFTSHSNGQTSANPTTNKPQAESKQQPQITSQNLNQSATQVHTQHQKDPFADIRPLVGQTVALQSVDKKPLPTGVTTLTVVVSKMENGQQTLQPQPMQGHNLPALKAKLPIEAPLQTTLKIDLQGNQAKILDVTPPKATMPVTSNPKATAPTANLKPHNLTHIQVERIVLTAEVKPFSKPLPQGATLEMTTLEKPQTLPTISQTTVNKQGQTVSHQVPQFKNILSTASGQKIEIISQEPIPQNTVLQLKQTASGLHVQNIVGQTTQSPHPTPSLPTGTPIDVKVIENLNNGMVKIALPQNQGTLEVKAPFPLTPQSNIKIMVDGDGALQITADSLPPQALQKHTAINLSNQWSHLKQSINLLQQASPDNGQQLQDNIPQMGQQKFLPQLLSFIDAVQQQTMQRFAGDEALNLLKALGVDFNHDLLGLQQSTQKNSDSPEQWRGLLFPYIENDPNNPKQGGFFWHQGEEAKGQKSDLRFLTQVHLDGLGESRLEGLIHEKDIKLKLSTQRPLTEVESQGLKSIVGQTIEAFGYTGQIDTFELAQKPEKPIHLLFEQMNNFINQV